MAIALTAFALLVSAATVSDGAMSNVQAKLLP